MALIDDIQTAYPAPRRAMFATDEPDCYCVGGAILLYKNLGTAWARDPRFPDHLELCEVLEELKQDNRDMLPFAEAIVHANDCGDFEKAWRLAGEALQQ